MSFEKINEFDLDNSLKNILQETLEHIDTHNIKTYTSLEQIGLTPGSETIESIVEAMPIPSILTLAVRNATFNMENYPYDGTFEMIKLGNSRVRATFISLTGDFYAGVYNSSASTPWSGWTKIANENEHNIKTYISLEQIGLVVGSETITDIIIKLPVGGMLIYGTNSQNAKIYPTDNCVV